MSWLNAVFNVESSALQRTFRVSDFLGIGSRLEIGTDASPYGLGGWLARDGRIINYFASSVSDHDVRIFGLERGSCTGQQILESLAILIAVKSWIPATGERVQLTIRSDNVGALTLVIRMRPKSAKLAIISRELAMHFTNFSFMPSVVHTPGIAHVLADKLSRLDDPSLSDAQDILNHNALRSASRTAVPTRDESYYKTLALCTSPLRSMG